MERRKQNSFSRNKHRLAKQYHTQRALYYNLKSKSNKIFKKQLPNFSCDCIVDAPVPVSTGFEHSVRRYTYELYFFYLSCIDKVVSRDLYRSVMYTEGKKIQFFFCIKKRILLNLQRRKKREALI